MNRELFELPDGWKVSTLGDVCKTTSGGTPSRSVKAYFQGDIPWVKSGELPDGSIQSVEEHITADAITNSSAKVFPSGTLLIALYGATVGKLGILNFNAASNQAVCAIFPKNCIETKYLFWHLRNVRSALIKKAVGGAQPNISQGILRKIPVPVAPVNQQKRIVEEIEKQFSRLDEAVANLKRVKANLKRYKASVLHAAVTGKLTEEWRKQNPDVEPASKLLERILAERRQKWEEAELARLCGRHARGQTKIDESWKPKNDKWKEKYKEPTAPDVSGLPDLPSGWKWVSLGAVTEAIGGYAFKSKDFSEAGHQVVKMANIKMGKLDLSKNPSFIRNVEDNIIEKYQLADGDILVTLTGTRKKRDYGYVVQIKAIPASMLLNQRIARLRPFQSKTSDFLSLALQSEDFRNRFFEHETGNVGQGNVGMKAVTIEPVLFPPHKEQQEIIEEIESRLSVAGETERTVDTNLKRAERLRQSILKQAFSGKLVSP